MVAKAQVTEDDYFNLQIGLGESQLALEERHFFDVAGYLVLEDLLTPGQVIEARKEPASMESSEEDEKVRGAGAQLCLRELEGK